MAVSLSPGISRTGHKLMRAQISSGRSSLEEEFISLGDLENPMVMETPHLLVIHELVKSRRLDELQLRSLTRQAVATLKASVSGGKRGE